MKNTVLKPWLGVVVLCSWARFILLTFQHLHNQNYKWVMVSEQVLPSPLFPSVPTYSCLPARLPTRPPAHPPTRPPAFFPFRPSIHPSVCPSVPPSLPLSLSPYVYLLRYLPQKNAGVFPPLIVIFHAFICSLGILNINCFVMCMLFCSVLLSSHGPDGPELFMIDPSGVSWVNKISSA